MADAVGPAPIDSVSATFCLANRPSPRLVQHPYKIGSPTADRTRNARFKILSVTDYTIGQLLFTKIMPICHLVVFVSWQQLIILL